MRRWILLCALASAVPALAGAQQRDTTAAPDLRALPRDVAREAVDLYNAPTTRRASGAFDVPADSVINGDLAVLRGPLTVEGRVTGNILAINGDVRLAPSSRVEGGVLVVGGDVTGSDSAFIGGDVRIFHESMRYHEEGEQIVVDHEDDRFWRRFERRRDRSTLEFSLTSGHTYNRVEGLPIHFGPTIRDRTRWGAVDVDLLGIFRTAHSFSWDRENIGDDARAEVQYGHGHGVGFGGRLFDVVTPVESWQLTDIETGFASFFLHRDFRDYFERHGGEATVRLFADRRNDFTIGLSDERWTSRRARDVWTLFRNDQNWRANPTVDDGLFHVASARLRVDTRTSELARRAGWYVDAEYEHGTGRVSSFGPSDARAVPVLDSSVSYGRVFVDLRRFNRISPDGQLNMRVVLGGWTDGDALPLERRLSVSGPGVLPGFDFRRNPEGGVDAGTCSPSTPSPVPGVPAQCDRIALAQLEYRGDINVRISDLWNWGGDSHGGDWFTDAGWLLFADAGRGWLVGKPNGDLVYSKSSVPPLSTFRTDLGAGLDFGWLGVYVAKAVSRAKEPANFFVRVKGRF